jgi:hypothetical protein
LFLREESSRPSSFAQKPPSRHFSLFVARARRLLSLHTTPPPFLQLATSIRLAVFIMASKRLPIVCECKPNR